MKMKLECMGMSMFVALAMMAGVAQAEDNVLSAKEKAEGWQLIFDGKSYAGWMNSNRKPSPVPIAQDGMNPHGCGAYMMVYDKDVSNFSLSLDFKIEKGCNSGVFVWTFPLEAPAGKDVGWNGIEAQVIDSTTADYHDTGAIYDLVRPVKNNMKPAGEWNHYEITCQGDTITVVLNGEQVSTIHLAEWDKPFKRPDGSDHKFDFALKDHPRHGYIGLQDHGGNCWYKNIKLKVLPGGK